MDDQKQKLWFKVLSKAGESIHGGSLKWSLPKKDEATSEWTAGDWHEVEGDLRWCDHPGLHITNQPAKWYASDCVIFVAEYEREFVTRENEDKISCRKVHLLREASIDELAAVNVFVVGDHEISDGISVVAGTASANVRDSATINYVGDSATINYVGGSATINYVRGSATIKDVRGSATINYVRDSATIKDVRGSATINYVGGSATINYVGGSATIAATKSTVPITPKGYGVVIDRSKNPPRVICGWQATTEPVIGATA